MKTGNARKINSNNSAMQSSDRVWKITNTFFFCFSELAFGRVVCWAFVFFCSPFYFLAAIRKLHRKETKMWVALSSRIVRA